MNLETLRAAFAGRLLTDRADMAPFLTDWRGKWSGDAVAVAQPDDTASVAAVVRWCRALVLSLTRLDRVRAVDPVCSTETSPPTEFPS